MLWLLNYVKLTSLTIFVMFTFKMALGGIHPLMGSRNLSVLHIALLYFQRELGDKNTEATDKLRQLLPLSKKTYEVITCEPHGTLVDSKGNKITFDSKAKKQVSIVIIILKLLWVCKYNKKNGYVLSILS